MNRFAALLDRLAYEPSRNGKLRLMTEYFRETPDPERGYALAAITGSLSFQHAKPGTIRALIAERADPVLFGLSWDYVGDLSETVALMWPAPKHTALSVPSPLAGEGQGGGYAAHSELHNHPPPHPSPARGEGADRRRGESTAPPLSSVVTTLWSLGKSELPGQIARWLDVLDETGRWALLKL